MLWSLGTLTSDNFPALPNLPGIFSVSTPVENHMQQGLRIARSFGATRLAAIVGQERHAQLMCGSAMALAPQMGYEETSTMQLASSFGLLRLLQARSTRYDAWKLSSGLKGDEPRV